MGLLFGTGRRSMPEEYRRALREMRKQRSPWYRGLRTAVILASVVAAALLIMCFAIDSLRKPILFKLVFVVLALCLGGAMCLPWITQLDRERRLAAKGEPKKGHRAVCYFFFGFIGLCIVLWVIAVFVIGDEILAKMLDPEEYGTDIAPGAFLFLRVALILSVQAVAGSVIATSTLRYGKKYFGLRVIMFATIFYLDIWLSWLIAAVTFQGLEAGTVYPVQNTALWVIAVLCAVGMLAATALFYGRVRRKEIELFLKGDVKKLTEGDVDLIDAEAAEKPSPKSETTLEKKFAALEELRQKGYITEEEYEKKRKELLDSM